MKKKQTISNWKNNIPLIQKFKKKMKKVNNF